MIEPPVLLDLGANAAAYATVLWVLLGLFVLRVIGQIPVMLWHPRWLPAAKEWYSGILSYPVLLPIQIVFIAVMVAMILGVSNASGTAAAGAPRGVGAGANGGAAGDIAALVVWFSYVYAAGMLVRFVVWLRRPPERRRAWIPIVFHIVLAGFLWVWGSAVLSMP